MDDRVSSHEQEHTDLRADQNPLTFGKRLREERDRVKLGQAETAGIGSVSRTSQHYYENDIRLPDADYLLRLHEAGVDVVYVLLGKRFPTESDRWLTVHRDTLWNVMRLCDEYCVDAEGRALSIDARIRFAQLLCAALDERLKEPMDLEVLRKSLKKVTGL